MKEKFFSFFLNLKNLVLSQDGDFQDVECGDASDDRLEQENRSPEDSSGRINKTTSNFYLFIQIGVLQFIC